MEKKSSKITKEDMEYYNIMKDYYELSDIRLTFKTGNSEDCSFDYLVYILKSLVPDSYFNIHTDGEHATVESLHELKESITSKHYAETLDKLFPEVTKKLVNEVKRVSLEDRDSSAQTLALDTFGLVDKVMKRNYKKGYESGYRLNNELLLFKELYEDGNTEDESGYEVDICQSLMLYYYDYDIGNSEQYDAKVAEITQEDDLLGFYATNLNGLM